MELKPCPFCGSNAEMMYHRFDYDDDFRDETYGVKCAGCGVQTHQFYKFEEMARAAWNTRTFKNG